MKQNKFKNIFRTVFGILFLLCSHCVAGQAKFVDKSQRTPFSLGYKYCLSSGCIHGLWEPSPLKPELVHPETKSFGYCRYWVPISVPHVKSKRFKFVGFSGTGHSWTMEKGNSLFIQDANDGPGSTGFGFSISIEKEKRECQRTSMLGMKIEKKDDLIFMDRKFIRLSPVEKALFRQRQRIASCAAHAKTTPVQYGFLIRRERLYVWVYQRTTMACWKYNPLGETPDPLAKVAGKTPKKPLKWEKVAESPLSIKGRIFLVPGEGGSALVVTDEGVVYHLKGNKAKEIAKVQFPKLQQPSKETQMPRLVLLEDQDKKKYVLFSWDGNKLVALDVQGQKKGAIAPFLQAKEVAPDVCKAVTVMIKAREEDTKKVLALRKTQKQKLEKLKAEKAKKPMKKSLQERLNP